MIPATITLLPFFHPLSPILCMNAVLPRRRDALPKGALLNSEGLCTTSRVSRGCDRILRVHVRSRCCTELEDAFPGPCLGERECQAAVLFGKCYGYPRGWIMGFETVS